jgi:nitronate monooxygenase
MPGPNARTVETLDEWMQEITTELAAASSAAPWILNMIVHRTYDRFDQEMELLLKYQPRIVSTALGSPGRVLEQVHGYGGIVMADVVTPELARKAADAGADILVLVTHGAGGHTGTYHPFPFIAEVRNFWNGPLGVAGAISSGREIRALQLLGVDFVMAGTRFIATPESLASPEYRSLLVDSRMQDLALTKAVSGVLANWLRPTLKAAGISESDTGENKRIDFSGDIAAAPKAWKDVWSAGHGVGSITRVMPVEDVVRQLESEYRATIERERADLASFTVP